MRRELWRAIRFPWQVASGVRGMLILVLLQIIPIVGQLILIGFGMAVARAAYRQPQDWPELHPRRWFVDGLRLTAIGIVYCLPVLLMVLLAVGSGDTPMSMAGIAMPLLVIAIAPISKVIVSRRPALKPLFTTLSVGLGLTVIVSLTVPLRHLWSLFGNGFQSTVIRPEGANVTLLLVSAFLMAFVAVAVLVVGVRFSVTGSGLLNPNATLKLMFAKPSLTSRFVVTVWLSLIGLLAVIIPALILFLVPGLLILVAGTASIWFFTAQFARQIGI